MNKFNIQNRNLESELHHMREIKVIPGRFPYSSVNFQLESWGVKHIAFSLQTHSV